MYDDYLMTTGEALVAVVIGLGLAAVRLLDYLGYINWAPLW